MPIALHQRCYASFYENLDVISSSSYPRLLGEQSVQDPGVQVTWLLVSLAESLPDDTEAWLESVGRGWILKCSH